MDIDEYQKKSAKYDLAKATLDLNAPGFVEKVLGLSGESGEVADKIKKIIRDKGGKPDKEDIEAVSKELGDTLWYVAAVARYLEIPMSKIARDNIDKLENRLQRNKLHGEGDER